MLQYLRNVRYNSVTSEASAEVVKPRKHNAFRMLISPETLQVNFAEFTAKTWSYVSEYTIIDLSDIAWSLIFYG